MEPNVVNVTVGLLAIGLYLAVQVRLRKAIDEAKKGDRVSPDDIGKDWPRRDQGDVGGK